MCARVPASTDVYCMGGFTDEDSEYILLQSVERFDLSTETWEYKADMVNPRADFGVGYVYSLILVTTIRWSVASASSRNVNVAAIRCPAPS